MSMTSDPPWRPGQEKRLHQLTALRFFAALAVLSSHLWVLEDRPNALRPIAERVFHEGFAGVSFFFVLSGYILAHTYQGRLVERSISRTHFLLLRLARIYPLHFLMAAPFAVGALWSDGASPLPEIGLNLALLQSWAPDTKYYFSLNAPSWSLSDEVFFYAAFCLLAVLTMRRLAQIAIALAFAAALIAAVLIAHGRGDWWVDGEIGFPHWWSYINPLTRLLDFVFGMLLYRCPVPRLDGKGWAVAEVLTPALLLCAMALSNTYAAPEVLRAQLLYLPFMGMILLVYGKGLGPVSRALTWPPLVLLGDASFALYLIHLPLLNLGLDMFDHLGAPGPVLAYAACAVTVCVLLSVIVHVLLERPIQRFLRRAIDGKYVEQGASVTARR